MKYSMLENLFRTFKNSPKIEFKSFSVTHGLIRLPPSRDFFAKNFIEKAFNFDFLERKYQKLALFVVYSSENQTFSDFFGKFFAKKIRDRGIRMSSWATEKDLNSIFGEFLKSGINFLTYCIIALSYHLT